MGRLTPSLRKARRDPSLGSRIIRPRARPIPVASMHLQNVAEVAYYAGRSCYYRPLFDRPRQWATQRSPRASASGHKTTRVA